MLAAFFFSMLVASPSPAEATSSGPSFQPASFARAKADGAGAPRAPDGAPGFGHGRTRRELERFLRSNAPADRAFLAGLSELARDVELELEALSDGYEERGWYTLLGDGPATPERLGLRFRELALDVPRALRAGNTAADVMARLLTDPRFRARASAIEGVGSELADVRGALQLLQAQTEGWVDLSDAEVALLCDRCDLAAARLRAIRLDLQALRELPCAIGASAPWQVDHERLRMFSRTHDHVRIERDLDPILVRLEAAEDAMRRPLFTAAFAHEYQRDLAARELARDQAQELLPAARALDPDGVSGSGASKSVAALGKSERRQRAARLAAQASGYDPLDQEAIWLAASTSDAAFGLFESRRWFDRYLALRGIRSHDDRTYRGRELTVEEKRALDAVHEAARLIQ